LPKVGIVYFTHTDITGELVNAAASEIEEAGLDIFLHRIKATEIVGGRFVNLDVFKNLNSCNAIIFASPTYMGGASAQFKAFADATSDFWESQEWSGKIAAGITSGAGLNGDQTSTLQYFSTLASQHGMLWIGIDSAYGNSEAALNRLGCQLGVVSQNEDGTAHLVDLATVKYLSRRVAKLAKQLLK